MSIMLRPEEVDDGYFTPVASTTLASIFEDDSSNDTGVNPSLKYIPPQPKKMEQSSKPDHLGSTQCLFSCSIIAYEWVKETHKCKGKVGFAMMQIVKTGQCKIILYSPDKSTLSCTTIVPLLEVTVKGAMISLYDDSKKYWGMCFNDKVIDEIKGLLTKENVIIKHYVSPEFKPEAENLNSDETIDETDSSTADDNSSTSGKYKASILNRIANVGHAILPSLPGSPIKKTIPLDIRNTLDVSPSVTETTSPSNALIQDQKLTKSIAIQASQNNTEMNSKLSDDIKLNQTTATNMPLLNNQIFTYINGYMVPLHMQLPVINSVDGDTSTELDLIIQKLTNLKAVVRTVEMKKHFRHNEKEEVQICTCKSNELHNETIREQLEIQNDNQIKKISDLEQLIREKDDFILKLQNEVQNETKKNSELIKDRNYHINVLNEQIEKLKQNLNTKNEVLKEIIPKKELDVVLANTVKNLMNNTYRSLASNFDSEDNYSGNTIKVILAAVIKKNTVESLSALLNNPDTANISTKPTD